MTRRQVIISMWVTVIIWNITGILRILEIDPGISYHTLVALDYTFGCAWLFFVIYIIVNGHKIRK